MPDLFFSKPKDKSLQAYKDWIMGVTLQFNPNAKDTKSEEEWIESWKKFWSKAEGSKDNLGPSASGE